MVGLISMMPTSWTMKNKSHKIEHNKYDTTKLKRLIPKQFMKISSLKVGKLTCFPD